MSDETTDSVTLCREPVRDVIHLTRLNLLTDHERRTLLDALGHGSGACVPFPEDACLIAAHKDLEARAEQAERERDRYRDALERIQRTYWSPQDLIRAALTEQERGGHGVCGGPAPPQTYHEDAPHPDCPECGADA